MQERRTAQTHFDFQLAKAARALAEAQDNEQKEQASLQRHKNDEHATMILRNAHKDLLQTQETLQEEEALARQHQQDT